MIAGSNLICWPDADLWLFGLLQSRAYTLWVGTVAGRLENDYSMAPDLACSTFPFPKRTAAGEERVLHASQAVLDAGYQTCAPPRTADRHPPFEVSCTGVMNLVL